MIIPVGHLTLKDPVNGSQDFVNGNTVSIFINASPTVEGYLVSEFVTTAPAPNDPRFSKIPPTSLNLYATTTATVYLWLKSFTENVNIDPIKTSIDILPLTPKATVRLIGIVEENGLRRDAAKIEIQESPGVKEYFFSESVTEPGTFSELKPTIAFFQAESHHTIFLWLRDQNNKINTQTISAHLYTPEDNQIGHRPGLVFVDENHGGITEATKTIRAVNRFGDFIEWKNIQFNPIGLNFSRIRLDRTANGYKIFVPNDSPLASNKYWETATIDVKSFSAKNLTIIYNNRVAYSYGEITYDSFFPALSIGDRIKIQVRHFDDVVIFDGISDASNEISLNLKEYDFCVLRDLFLNSPILSADPQAYTDHQLNFSLSESIPVSIGIIPNNYEISFLTTFNQAGITFTGERLKRAREFGLGTTYILSLSGLPDFITTNTITVEETSVVIKHSEVSTTAPYPSFEFDVINPANTFAVFTIQFSNEPTFTSPVVLTFRLTQDDPKFLTLISLDKHEISFMDLSTSFGFGTIFWRVSRNHSDFTDPGSFTVTSSAVTRIEFTLDSQFKKEIGKTAIVKVQAFDAVNTPVEGAKINFTVEKGSTLAYSNTVSTGITAHAVSMPITRQEFLLTAENKTNIITHIMEAEDSPHLESEINFDRVENPPPIVRYIIYRKLLAEVRTEEEDQILRVSQTPLSPIIRKDSTDEQEGVVFDPLNEGLEMARDIAWPREVDRRKPPITVIKDDCNIRISWQQGKERGTTWHYDGKAVSNQHVLSEEFSTKPDTEHKFDVLFAYLANNDTISPSPYPTHGETFPAHIVERIDANYSRPVTLTTDLFSQITTVDTNKGKSFDAAPNPVQSLTITSTALGVRLNWINPPITNTNLSGFVYRVRNFDIGGNSGYSQIRTPPATMQQCIAGTLVTRINSTECFEEERFCETLDTEMTLVHGSILSSSLIIKKLPECIQLKSGIDYTLTNLGNENLGTRGKVIFHSTGLVETDDNLRISYRYGRAIDCGDKPTPEDLIINPHAGNIFLGPSTNDTVLDYTEITDPVAYTFGVWVVSDSGKISEGRYAQILVDD